MSTGDSDGGHRPTVLHCVPDWGVPSERFVVDLVTSMSLTQPVVACGRRHEWGPAAETTIPVTALLPKVARLPYRFRRAPMRAIAIAFARRHRTRLVHTHFGYWAAHGAAIARRLRVPYVVSLHGHDVLVAASETQALGIRDADIVIVPSRFLADAAAAHGVGPDRIRIIPSGIDVDSYAYRARTLAADGVVRVTFAGRFVPKKGVLDAARAMSAVADQGSVRLRCRFVGYGPQEDELRTELAALRLDATIEDGRDPLAVRRAFDDTDLLLTASRTAPDGDAESLGLVNIEAQACGIPVISTAHGGIPDAVAPDAGVLVPEGDVAQLSKALGDLVAAPQRWPAMGAAGREHVLRTFRLADRVRDVEEHYLALIDNQPRDVPTARPCD